jgi:hypothetical protein
MTRKGIALLLILFIGFSPVASAFADCPESSHSESGHASFASAAAEDSAMMLMADDRLEADGHGGRENVGCHTGSVCVFHLCGGLGLPGSIRVTASFSSNTYPPSIRANFDSRTFAPELEPPIRTPRQRERL